MKQALTPLLTIDYHPPRKKSLPYVIGGFGFLSEQPSHNVSVGEYRKSF